MISIVIPVFNGIPWLAEAIESALSQTVKTVDIICINDGSADASLDICRRYPVKVIDQTNKGLASARNTGIMNSAGGQFDWILFLDADDKLLPNAVEKILEVIKQNPNDDVIAPSFKTFGLAEQEVILMPEPKLEDFKTGNRLGYCAAIRRSALLAVGGYSPRMTYGYEDLHLWINLLTRGYKIKTIPDILWLYRMKGNSMIHEAQAHHEELLVQINKDFPEAKLSF